MRRHWKLVLVGVLALSVIAMAFFAADSISESHSAQRIVERFGILGIVLISFIAGLNLFVPVHAATFTPVFLNAGFMMPVIIAAMIVGTTAADILGYIFGRWGKHRTHAKYQDLYIRLEKLQEKHQNFILPGIFLYSAFAPLPNELILIPLGLMGYRFIVLIGPLVLGTLVQHTIFSHGFTTIFEFLF